MEMVVQRHTGTETDHFNYIMGVLSPQIPI